MTNQKPSKEERRDGSILCNCENSLPLIECGDCRDATAPSKSRSPYYSDGWYFETTDEHGDAVLHGPYFTRATAVKAGAR